MGGNYKQKYKTQTQVTMLHLHPTLTSILIQFNSIPYLYSTNNNWNCLKVLYRAWSLNHKKKLQKKKLATTILAKTSHYLAIPQSRG